MTVFDAEMKYFEMTSLLYQMNPQRVQELWSQCADRIESDLSLQFLFFIAFCRMAELEKHRRLVDLLIESDRHLPTYRETLKFANLYRRLRGTYFGPLVARMLIRRYRYCDEVKLFSGYYKATWTDHQQALRFTFPLLLLADLKPGPSSCRYKWTHGFILCLNGIFDHGVELVKEGVAEIDTVPDETLRRLWKNEGLDLLANCLYHIGEAESALRVHAEADAVFGRPNEFPFAWVFNHTMRLRTTLSLNNQSEFTKSVGILKAILREKYDSRFALRAHSYSAVLAALNGKGDEAFYELSVADSFSQKTSSPLEYFYHLNQKSRVFFISGLPSDARDIAIEAERGIKQTANDGIHRIESLEQMILMGFVGILRMPMSKRRRRDEIRSTTKLLTEYQAAVARSKTLYARARVYRKLLSIAQEYDEDTFVTLAQSAREVLGIRSTELCLAIETDRHRLKSEERVRSAVTRASQNLERLGELTRLLEKLKETNASDVEGIVAMASDCLRRLTESKQDPEIGHSGFSERKDCPIFDDSEFLAQGDGIFLVRKDSLSFIAMELNFDNRSFVIWSRQGSVDPGMYLDVNQTLILLKQLALKHWQDSNAHDLRARQEQAKALSDQARQVAHDIRSPLGALRMTIHSEASGLGPEQRSIVVQAIERMELIANQLLKSTRAPKLDGLPTESAARIGRVVEIDSLISDSLSEKSIEIPGFGNLMRAELGEHARVYIDPDEFKCVFSNILNNAIEAMPETDGRIVVRVERHGDQADVSISDNGRGIPADIVNRLGRENVSFGKDNGNGLGLFQASKFTQRFNGRLRVESKLGIGTKVTIALPVSEV